MTNPSLNGERSFLCPKCNGMLQVIDSRPASISNRQSIRRRRICKACSYRFTTFEISEEDMLSADRMKAKVERARVFAERSLKEIAEITT